MNETPPTDKAVEVKRQATRALRSLKSYQRASVAYNRDCNIRVPILPGDTKNNKLMWKSQKAFNKLIDDFTLLLHLSSDEDADTAVSVSKQK